MSKSVMKVKKSVLPAIISVNDSALVSTPVEAVSTPHSIEVLPLPLGISSNSVSIAKATPLIWRYKDVDIELGNRFSYIPDDDTDNVADFEVRGKVVKCFLRKDPMYNQNLNVKATAEDVNRIKAIVLAAPNCDASRPSFEWPFEANKEGVFKFVNKDNLKVDFAEIFNAAEMNNAYDLDERRRHSLEAHNVRLGSRVMVEFTIAIWRKKPRRAGCTFHLISVGVLETSRENISGSFQSPKKRQRTGQ